MDSIKYTNPRQLLQALTHLYILLENHRTGHQYLIFSSVTRTQFEEDLTSPQARASSSKFLKYCYHHPTQSLAVKVPLPLHYPGVANIFKKMVDRQLFKMDLLDTEYWNDALGDIVYIGDWALEPDISWVPSAKTKYTSPSVVLEVGTAEDFAQLADKASIWLESFESNVQAFITIQLDYNNEGLASDTAIKIAVWRLAPTNKAYQSVWVDIVRSRGLLGRPSTSALGYSTDPVTEIVTSEKGIRLELELFSGRKASRNPFSASDVVLSRSLLAGFAEEFWVVNRRGSVDY
ncbi:hypothetical protein N7474_009881 [Penicillium riverlandense]|uniref:uncharacterized protein n=1 Tax=Penicillium riverlandense TaxID=1903569 RepID=UPI0025470E8C|nr:uncharacterized protein N7474_009881 [Penicillium riverlandense]KAJ5808612.1 hypothetical protein N7474_009881 [Penicillium riverlandense]